MLGPLCIFILARYDRELNTCSVFSLVGDWSEWSESVWMIRLGWLYSYGYWLNSGWLNTGWLNTGYWLNCDIWLIRCCCSTILYWNIYCCICNRCSFSFSTYSLGYNIPLCFLDFILGQSSKEIVWVIDMNWLLWIYFLKFRSNVILCKILMITLW